MNCVKEVVLHHAVDCPKNSIKLQKDETISYRWLNRVTDVPGWFFGENHRVVLYKTNKCFGIYCNY